MIRVLDAKDVITGEERYIEYAGLSTDTKPVEEKIATGSTFLEVDTGDVYFFNEDAAPGSEWVKAGGA